MDGYNCVGQHHRRDCSLFLRMTIYVNRSSIWKTIIPWTVDYGLMVEIGNILLFWPNQHETKDPLDGCRHLIFLSYDSSPCSSMTTSFGGSGLI